MQDVRKVWLMLFLWSHFFVLFSGVAELEQEVRCIIHRSVSVRSDLVSENFFLLCWWVCM